LTQPTEETHFKLTASDAEKEIHKSVDQARKIRKAPDDTMPKNWAKINSCKKKQIEKKTI